jgi:hypothetical protein
MHICRNVGSAIVIRAHKRLLEPFRPRFSPPTPLWVSVFFGMGPSIFFADSIPGKHDRPPQLPFETPPATAASDSNSFRFKRRQPTQLPIQTPPAPLLPYLRRQAATAGLLNPRFKRRWPPQVPIQTPPATTSPLPARSGGHPARRYACVPSASN